MEFNLTNEQKKKMLDDAKNAIHSELYLLMVKMGVDPDTYVLGDILENDIKYAGERVRFEGLVSSLQKIEEKLADLT